MVGQGDPKTARFTFQSRDFRFGDHVNVAMPADLDQFR
jgi:hypothetical protein